MLQGVVSAEEEVVDTDDGALYTEHIDEGGDHDIEELLMHGDEDDEASRALRNEERCGAHARSAARLQRGRGGASRTFGGCECLEL